MKIAILPARGNSRRIKNKNIKQFFGKPIIYYSIKEAKKTKLFDKIVVTTDSKRIKNISLKLGANIAVNRNKKLSMDKVGVVEVVKNTINYLEKKKIKPDFVCCIFPASPLIEFNNIIKGYKQLIKTKKDFIFAGKQVNDKNQKLFFIKNRKLNFIKNKNISKNYFVTDAGQFYWAKKTTWMKNKTTFTKNSSFLTLSQFRSQDINTQSDFEISKLLFKLSTKLKNYLKK